MSADKFDYFIDETNRKFERAEQINGEHFSRIYQKLDQLMGFRWLVAGAIAAGTAIISVAVTILLRH